MVAVAVPLALAAAWGGVWWWLGQRVAAAVEGEIAVLDEVGLRVRYDARSTGGFPFAIEQRHAGVTVTPRDGDWTLSLPEIRSRASLFAPDAVRSAIGPDAPGMARVGTLRVPADGPAETEIAIGAERLRLDLPVGGEGPLVAFAADALSLVETQREIVLDAVLDLREVAGRLDAVRTASSVPGHRLRVSAAEAAFAQAPVVPGLLRRTEVTGRAVELEAVLAGLRGRTLADAIDAPGQFLLTLEARETETLDLTYGATLAAVSAQDPQARARGIDFGALPVQAAVRARGQGNRQRLALAEGRLEIASETGNGAIELALPAFGGGFSVDSAAFAFTMPLRPAPIPEAFGLMLSVRDLRPDEETWRELDPDAVVARAPLTLEVDIGGEVAVNGPLGSADMLGQPPVSVQAMEIRHLALAGFGASGSAEGHLAPGPGGLAEGRVTVRLEGWRALLEAARRLAGLDPLQALSLAAMAETLRDPGNPDALRADIAFSEGTVSVNGQRLR